MYLSVQRIFQGLKCINTCKDDFNMAVVDRMTCQADGTWSEPLPQCLGFYKCEKLVLQSEVIVVEPAACAKDSVAEGTAG